MRLTRRECIAAIGAFAATSGCKSSRSHQVVVPAVPAKAGGISGMAPLRTFTPENFGAAGDGRTNDTDAFARMAAVVNANGGGTVVLQRRTYLVGRQGPDPSSPYAYAPAPIMEFYGCVHDVTIVGNGARIRCADGLRFGTFDRRTGLPTNNAMPNYDVSEIASPYLGMITVQNCTGKVQIENLELDGNLEGLIIGGNYGDTGWQIPACGLRLLNNTGSQHISNVYSHHHALDGVLIDDIPDRDATTSFENLVSEYNARQGCSIVGGRNYSFANCRFSHTGKAGLASAPAAGIDIESEVNPIRNLSFSNCEFSNNTGVGMLADSGDTESATFDNCRFVGTTAWSAWPCKPKFRFTDCQFVGAIVRVFGDADLERVTQFLRCTFTDDPSLSPTGEVYGASWTVADLGGGDLNVLFDACRFTLKNNLVLPWTLSSTFKNCTMSQLSSRQAYPRGTFTGVNKIDGNVDIYGSKVLGPLTINGTLIPING